MISFKIPGIGEIELENAVLDLNGTIACDGKIPEEVKSKLNRLSEELHIYLLTADTYGTVEQTISGLAIEVIRIPSACEAQKKGDFVLKIGKEGTVAVGNGANDALMLKESRIGIAIIGCEGASKDAIINADITVCDVKDAMDLILYPKRIISTLRR